MPRTKKDSPNPYIGKIRIAGFSDGKQDYPIEAFSKEEVQRIVLRQGLSAMFQQYEVGNFTNYDLSGFYLKPDKA